MEPRRRLGEWGYGRGWYGQPGTANSPAWSVTRARGRLAGRATECGGNRPRTICRRRDIATAPRATRAFTDPTPTRCCCARRGRGYRLGGRLLRRFPAHRGRPLSVCQQHPFGKRRLAPGVRRARGTVLRLPQGAGSGGRARRRGFRLGGLPDRADFPLLFHSPMGRLSLRLHRTLLWNLGYQHYRYNEDLTSLQDYRAHTGYSSVVWSF